MIKFKNSLLRLLQTPWPCLLWTAIIFYLLTMNTGKLQQVPLFRIPYLDKYIHVFLFSIHAGLLGIWMAHRLSQKKGYLILTLLFSLLYGIAMEFYQEAFTSRAFEMTDILADGTGALLGGLFIGMAKKKPLWK